MGKTLRQAILTAFLIFCTFSLLSFAQDSSRLEFFGAYSHLRYDSSTLGFKDYTGLNGGNVGFTFNVTTRFGVVGEIGGAWGSPFKLYDAMAGPRYSYRRGNLSLFGQGLLGKAKTHVEIPTVANGGETSSAFAWSGGGGADYQLTHRFSVRLFQVDYMHTKAFQIDQNNLRFSVGVIYRLGEIKRHKRPRLTP